MSDTDSISSDDENTGFVRRYFRDMGNVASTDSTNMQSAPAPFFQASSGASPLRNATPLSLRHAPTSQMQNRNNNNNSRKHQYERDVSKATDALWSWSSAPAQSVKATAANAGQRNSALPPPQRHVHATDSAQEKQMVTVSHLLRDSVLAAIRQLPSDLCVFHMASQNWRVDTERLQTAASSSATQLPPLSVVRRLLLFADEVGQLGNFTSTVSALPSVSSLVLSLSDNSSRRAAGNMDDDDDDVLGLVTPVSVVQSALGWIATHVLQRVALWAATTAASDKQSRSGVAAGDFVELLHHVDLALRPVVRTLLGLIEAAREMEYELGQDYCPPADAAAPAADLVDIFVAYCDTAAADGGPHRPSCSWIFTAASVISLTSAFIFNMHRALSSGSTMGANSKSSRRQQLAVRTFSQVGEPLLWEIPLLMSVLGLSPVDVQARLRSSLSMLQTALTQLSSSSSYSSSLQETALETARGGRQQPVCGDLAQSQQHAPKTLSDDGSETSTVTTATTTTTTTTTFLLAIDADAPLLVRFHAMPSGSNNTPPRSHSVRPVRVSDCERPAAWMVSDVASRVVNQELSQLRAAAASLLVGEMSLLSPSPSPSPSPPEKSGRPILSDTWRGTVFESASPVAASLHLVKRIGLFQAWSTLQELFVDRLLVAAQPRFCAHAGFSTARTTFVAAPGDFWASAKNLQRWFADVLEAEHVPRDHAVLMLLGSAGNEQGAVADATGVSIVRTLASIRLKLKLHPALQIIAFYSNQRHQAESSDISGDDVPLLDVLESVFSTLLTLTFAVRRLQSEFKASRNQPNRSYWRLLHTCSFALDAVLRFVTTEVEAMSNMFQAALLVCSKSSDNSNKPGNGWWSVAALEAAFRAFSRGLRGVAVSTSTAASSAITVAGDGVARAIASHVATLCAVACDSSRIVMLLPSAEASGGTAAAINAAARQQQELERELQRVDLTCRSLVAVLRGLRLETTDSAVEQRCSALLATLTFNQFY